MNTPTRYILIVLGVIIGLHYILSFSHEDYGRATSISSITSHFKGKPDSNINVPEEYHVTASPLPTGAANSSLVHRRANATFVILARNSDTESTVRSVREIEDRFNKKFGYPYVFLNDEPFTEDFKRRISVLSSVKMEFGQVPREQWVQPDWIDEAKAKAGREQMEKDKIIYGGSVSYRNMCRFNSGFFFRHELVQKYRYYWCIEPDVHFHCDIDYDPFLFLQDKKKVYGFTITMYEYIKTIPTLWGHVQDFVKQHPEFVAKDNAMGFMLNDDNSYNLCHFWSNFEIADMEFWRGPAYTAFFEYLDSKGGFYYERWGDAPVHSIAAAIFASRDQLHFFNDIGYEHNPYTHCPRGEDVWKRGRCTCNPDRNFDYDGYSCMSKWDKFIAG